MREILDKGTVSFFIINFTIAACLFMFFRFKSYYNNEAMFSNEWEVVLLIVSPFLGFFIPIGMLFIFIIRIIDDIIRYAAAYADKVRDRGYIIRKFKIDPTSDYYYLTLGVTNEKDIFGNSTKNLYFIENRGKLIQVETRSLTLEKK